MTFVLDNYDSFVTPSAMRSAPDPSRRRPRTRVLPAERIPLGVMVRIAARFTPSFSCGEGKPLPTPLPRGAARRERPQDEPS